jgi:hypothetical protein
MKGNLNILVIVILVILAIALSIGAFQYLKKNEISISNRLKTDAQEKYLSGKYPAAYEAYKMLVDSLANQEEPVLINYANAGYLTADALSREPSGQNQNQPEATADSALQQVKAETYDRYLMLSAGKDKAIRSIASNQLGYGLIRGKNIFESSNPDSILYQALDHFKDALRSDPMNDSARYNYELLKKIVDYPETILSETKALIAQKRYRAAAALLASGMQRDPRLRKQTDFMQRLRTVIAIDSLKSRSI